MSAEQVRRIAIGIWGTSFNEPCKHIYPHMKVQLVKKTALNDAV